MRRLSSKILPCLLAVGLSACSSFSGMIPESKKVDYKSAGNKLPRLEVPPDLTAPGRDGSAYVVPEAPGAKSVTASSQAGQAPVAAVGSNVLPEVGSMRIERAGTQRWLLVPDVPPEKLWSLVKEFWQENNLLINVDQPQAGVMETEWAENRAKIPQDGIRNLLGKALDNLYSTAERDKYRTRLERTPAGGTEIYISHHKMEEVYVTEGKNETRWQPARSDPDMEAEMLTRLMVRLGADKARARTQVAQAAAVKEERAKLTQPGAGGGTLEVEETFDRAWRRVGLALDRVGFTVEDRDRSQGIYYVRYVDPEADTKGKKDSGILSKLAFWRSDDKDAGKNVQYRIYVKGNGPSSTVQVLTREGGVDTSDTSRKILKLLYDQLK